ncbi:aromatic-ring hydroxylase C-terminal domain-containing protein [Glycomyces halotolerans]
MQISGLGIAYGRRPGDDRIVGTRVRDRRFDDGTRLFEHLRGFALIGAPAIECGDQVALLPGPAERAVLVRPDGHAAWAGAPERAERALRSWCGSAS